MFLAEVPNLLYVLGIPAGFLLVGVLLSLGLYLALGKVLPG
jgi:hypothetical protein